MAALDERATRLEGEVEKMDAEAKAHFVELRTFIAGQLQSLEVRFQQLENWIQQLESRIQKLESRIQKLENQIQQLEDRTRHIEVRIAALDWKVTWVILPALAVIGSSIVWLGFQLSAAR